MRLVSPVALGLMLALGSVSFGVAVPGAVAKEKKAAPAKLNLSPDFIKPIAKASEAVQKKDVAAAKAALAEAEPLIKSNDDRYQYYAIMLNTGLTAQDQTMQIAALRGMIDTGLVPAEQIGQFSTVAASAALEKKDYDGALTYAQKAEAAGYKPEQVSPIMAQAIWGKAGNNGPEIARGLQIFRKGIDAMKASGQPVPAQWYQVGVSKAAAANLPELSEWAGMAYAAQPSGENLRTVLRVFQRANPTMTNRENLDLLRLMDQSGGLAVKPDYTEYAEMAFKSALYGEVKSTLDNGRAKGVLTASDGSDFYTVANQRIAADKASLASAERDAGKAANGKIAAATADAYLGYDNYAKAAQLYELALQKGGVDVAEVNTRLGIARALGGNTAGAKEALAKVQGGVRGGIAKLWSNYIDSKSAPAAQAAPAA